MWREGRKKETGRVRTGRRNDLPHGGKLCGRCLWRGPDDWGLKIRSLTDFKRGDSIFCLERLDFGLTLLRKAIEGVGRIVAASCDRTVQYMFS